MKWTTLLLICGIALVFDACQKHGVQELKLLEPAHEAGAESKTGESKANPPAAEHKP